MPAHTFDLTSRIDRSFTGSAKWDARPNALSVAGYPPLSVADMELRVAPCIEHAICEAAHHGIYGYTDSDGIYQDAVVNWMSTQHDWEVRPSWIVTTPGVIVALKLAIRAFTQPGDGVIVQPPVYYPFLAAPRQNDRVIVENPLVVGAGGRYRMDLDDLERKAADPRSKLLLLCNPHNPVGRVWERTELEDVVAICLEHGVVIVSDEIHGDIILGETPLTSMGTLTEKAAGNCIVCTAVSKTFNLAGLVNSNIIIPDDGLRNVYAREAGRTVPYGIPYFSRVATIAAYTQGAPWVADLLDLIRTNDELLTTTIHEHFPQVACFPLEGTYLAWNDWRKLGMGAEELGRFMLDEAGLMLDEGTLFGTGGSGFERWNLAAPTAIIEESLARLVEAGARRGLTR